MFNEFVKLKMLTKTYFASIIVMLKRFATIKLRLQTMMISDK